MHSSRVIALVFGTTSLLGCSATASPEVLQVEAVGPPAATPSEPVPSPGTGASISGCLLAATAAVLPSDDPRGARRGHFPPAEPPPPGVSPLTQGEAEATARQARGRRGQSEAPPDTPVKSIQQSYGEWALQAGMPLDKFIDPARCVWVIKVAAPFRPSPPPGQEATPQDSYTVIIDAASRTMIGLTAP